PSNYGCEKSLGRVGLSFLARAEKFAPYPGKKKGRRAEVYGVPCVIDAVSSSRHSCCFDRLVLDLEYHPPLCRIVITSVQHGGASLFQQQSPPSLSQATTTQVSSIDSARPSGTPRDVHD